MMNVVGIGVGRTEGVEKVSGKTRYTADLTLPGLLWGLTLRSPLPHAKIVRIDTSRARAVAGVKAVLTGLDAPDVRIGRHMKDLPILAKEKVRFVGEKVAAVAAESREAAEEALSLIEVDYEGIPAVFDPVEAMQEGAPVIHENPGAYEGAPAIPRILNVLSLSTKFRGNTELGFGEADRIFEHTFRTPVVHQGYLEPHACVVDIEPGGKVHVWASNKSPFLLRGQVAAGLQIPVEDVIVHLQPVGGDFGGKGSPMDAHVAYFLAKASGRPVKMVMSYSEELMAGNPRHASVITVRTGIKKSGELQSVEIKAVFDSGAYGAFKPIPDLNLAGAHTAGGIAYHVPHIKIDSYVVYTNNVPCGHMRGPGYPQICFAIESQIDIIAKAIGMDPVEFRMANLFDTGDEPLFGGHWENIKAKETLQRAVQASGWKTPKARPYVGRGLAIMQKSPGVSPTGAHITIDFSGRVTLRMGIPEQGSGSHTIARQIIAQELQIPLDLVSIETGSTDYTPDSGWGAGASSVTHCLGQAVLLAAREARAQLLKDAAGLLQTEERAIALENCNFVIRANDNEMQIPFRELVSRLVAQRGRAYEIMKIYDWAAGNKGAYSFTGVTSFCAQVAEVEVDPDTGQVSILKITTAHDVGTILNPITHQGQIDGGVLQGMGFAVMEELCVQDGRVSTLHLGDYKIPNIKDVPELITVLIQEPAGPIPYQGKSIGEIGTIPIPAAVANAVCDATGVRLWELPQSAERIYWALKGSGTDAVRPSSCFGKERS